MKFIDKIRGLTEKGIDKNDEKFIKYMGVQAIQSQQIQLIKKDIPSLEYLQYRVITKEDFIRYMINSKKACNINKNAFKQAEEIWDKWRRGYNFMIAAGNGQLVFYSIESFNKCVIGGSVDD